MRTLRLHSQYTSANRYMGRSSGYKRTSGSFSNKYKLSSGKYRSLLDETKKDLEELDDTTKTSDTAQKAERTKTSDFTTTGSRYNKGMDAISDSIDDFAVLLKKDALDHDKAYDAASSFVSGYNNVYSSIKNASSGSISNKATYFNNLAKTFSRALDKVGVSVNEKDGSLSINKEKFSKASARDIGNIFGANASYATMVEQEAGSVSKVATATASSANTYSSLFNSPSSAASSALSGAFFNKKY